LRNFKRAATAPDGKIFTAPSIPVHPHHTISPRARARQPTMVWQRARAPHHDTSPALAGAAATMKKLTVEVQDFARNRPR
jgi:hypothetical protein